MHKPAPATPASPRFVLVKGTDGLGNRMFSLLSALLYAKLAGRTLVVDWRDGQYADPGINAFPALFRSDSVSVVERIPPSASAAPWMWERRLEASAEDVRRRFRLSGVRGCPFVGGLYSFDPTDLHHAEDVLVTWSLIPVVAPLRRHFTGPWRAWSRLDDDAILGRLLRENLDVHPDVTARVEEIRRTWSCRPRIGVHVRHTDRTTNLPRLRRRLDRLVAASPDADIFLATDAASVENDFRRRYPGILTVPKWFAPGGPLHALSAPCPDRLEMARMSLVEMRLLAGCDQLVINGNSSYSVITKLWWKGDPARAVDVGAWAWLPSPVRSRAWRVRDSIRWMRPLRLNRRQLERQKPTCPS